MGKFMRILYPSKQNPKEIIHEDCFKGIDKTTATLEFYHVSPNNNWLMNYDAIGIWDAKMETLSYVSISPRIPSNLSNLPQEQL